MKETANQIDCEFHGKSNEAFVCRHLFEGKGLGFNQSYDPENPDDICPDAWCDQCESVLEKEGKWNENSEEFADIRLVCEHCYEEIRARNWKQDEEAIQYLISNSFQYLQEKQADFLSEFEIESYERWDWKQDEGRLIFSNDDIPLVEADIQFVGTISTVRKTWLWAWANQSLNENIKSESRFLKDEFNDFGYEKLSSARWTATEEDGWEMTAILAKETNAIGAYRTPSEDRYVYMIVTAARKVGSNKDE